MGALDAGNTFWDLMWVAWFLGCVLTFLFLEIRAYDSHHTLSETVWRLLHAGEGPNAGNRWPRLLFLSAWVLLFVLLSVHFFFQWF